MLPPPPWVTFYYEATGPHNIFCGHYLIDTQGRPLYGSPKSNILSNEGISSLIQAAKARGYRTIKNLITMIYLIGGKLEFRLPI